MADKIDPSVPSSDYAANAASWKVIRTVMAGTEAMRAAGTTYLPQHPSEESADYQARLAETVLTNRLEDAVRAVVGKPLGDPLKLSGSYNAKWDEWADDIDLLGNSIDVFARGLFEDSVAAGLAYIVVDMPKAEPGMSLADELKANIRPYFVHYTAENVLAIYITVEDGKPKVTEARTREDTIKVVNFKEVIVRRIRVRRALEWELWEQETSDNGEGDWKIVEKGPNELGEVAIVPLFTGRRASKTGFRVKPVFLDLAWKNVEHWQSSSDQRHILKYARFPILAGSGVKLPKPRTRNDGSEMPPQKIGPHSLLITEDPQGKWYYVEPEGHAIEAGANDLRRLEEEMAALALKPHTKRSGDMTATGEAIGEARENSAVKNMALNLKDALEQAFAFAARLIGEEPDTSAPEVEVSTDYTDEYADTADLDGLLKVRVAREISRKTFWSELQRRGKLSANFDPDVEAIELQDEGGDDAGLNGIGGGSGNRTDNIPPPDDEDVTA